MTNPTNPSSPDQRPGRPGGLDERLRSLLYWTIAVSIAALAIGRCSGDDEASGLGIAPFTQSEQIYVMPEYPTYP
ncbi:MAG: hypothetical protein KIH63_002090 [Candidatus Saccharibacteria bacterium]|nr:hypothetical protein [Candidatus Saccharibacteria bacterium]